MYIQHIRRTPRWPALVLVAAALASSSASSAAAASTAADPCATAVRSQWVSRAGSSLCLDGRPWRFTGVNAYWLGLDDNVGDRGGATYPSASAIDDGLRSAAALGARVVRSTTLGVSVGSPRSLEPTLGTFNNAAFAPIDYAVARARHFGLRLMIPLTDEWQYYHGGKHTFTNWTGHPDIPGQSVSTSAAQRVVEANFYTDPRTIAAFHQYVAHLLDHVNPRTGLRLGADPTIAIWETGNELWDAPPVWTGRTAAFIKSLAPHALVADGSASTGKDVTETAVDQPAIDIVDAHFYPVDRRQAMADASYVRARGKVYVIGEFPLTGTPATTSAWLAALAGDRAISGDLAWTLLPHLPDGRPEPHGEAYTFHWPGANATETVWDGWLIAHSRAMRA